MSQRNNVEFHIETREDLFQTRKSITLYADTITQKSLTSALKSMKSELQKVTKKMSDDVWFEIFEMDSQSYRFTDRQYRIIFQKWADNDGLFTLQVRKYTGYDFSDTKEMKFVALKDAIQYVITLAKGSTYSFCQNDIPEIESYYMQSRETTDSVID